MWINVTRGPDDRLVSDVAPRANDRVVANFCSGFDHRQRLNGNTVAELNAWIDDRAGMNTRRKSDRLRGEFEHDLLERLGRIWNTNLRGIDWFGKIRRNKNRRCLGLAQQRDVFSIR